MATRLPEDLLWMAHSFASATGVTASLFDFSIRDFLGKPAADFCSLCQRSQQGQCDSRLAHTYGCFEAERWNGLYVYFCPLSLAFVSTVVFMARRAAYSIISGPYVMGLREDLPKLTEGMQKAVGSLPQRSPAQINALAEIQRATAMYLSGRKAEDTLSVSATQSSLHNTLYELTSQMRCGQGSRYPIEVEQRLQKMIIQGDKQGAQELINQLLGTLYFHTTGDFAQIKERAQELIVLFSRASIEGGADVTRIFGHHPRWQLEVESISTMDELSQWLTSMFYRFVGYVFDFSQFEHADIMRKAVNYLRENLSKRVTLEELANHVSLSRSYLSTIFKAELGQSFTDFVNQMRIEKSKELLLNPALSLAAIADLVGYTDQSYFTKKFALLTGLSPGQYRKKGGTY